MYLSIMIATPSEPLNLILTRITYDSCELEWNPPSDNGGGGQVISHYSITGTPDDINISYIINTMITIPNLTPNTEYTFNVSATNSLGLGDPAIVQCSTTGNSKTLLLILIFVNHILISHTVPPGFTDVSVCLDFNMIGYTELDINYSVSLCGKFRVQGS